MVETTTVVLYYQNNLCSSALSFLKTLSFCNFMQNIFRPINHCKMHAVVTKSLNFTHTYACLHKWKIQNDVHSYNNVLYELLKEIFILNGVTRYRPFRYSMHIATAPYCGILIYRYTVTALVKTLTIFWGTRHPFSMIVTPKCSFYRAYPGLCPSWCSRNFSMIYSRFF